MSVQEDIFGSQCPQYIASVYCVDKLRISTGFQIAYLHYLRISPGFLQYELEMNQELFYKDSIPTFALKNFYRA